MMHLVAVVIAAVVSVPIIWAIAMWRDKTVEALMLARPVGAAQAITDEDLTTVDLTPDRGTRFIAAAERPSVLSHVLAVGLPAGTILTADQVNPLWFAGPGFHLVGILTSADQRPAQPLRPGATICVSRPPIPRACGAGAADSFRARFAEASRRDPDGLMVIDVIVGSADLEAALSAASSSMVLVSLVGA